jgi:hypothetical protein
VSGGFFRRFFVDIRNMWVYILTHKGKETPHMPRSPNRLRDTKLHIWARSTVVKPFLRIADNRGLSRDGAFEESMNLFIRKHRKASPNVGG